MKGHAHPWSVVSLGGRGRGAPGFIPVDLESILLVWNCSLVTWMNPCLFAIQGSRNPWRLGTDLSVGS